MNHLSAFLLRIIASAALQKSYVRRRGPLYVTVLLPGTIALFEAADDCDAPRIPIDLPPWMAAINSAGGAA